MLVRLSVLDFLELSSWSRGDVAWFWDGIQESECPRTVPSEHHASKDDAWEPELVYSFFNVQVKAAKLGDFI